MLVVSTRRKTEGEIEQNANGVVTLIAGEIDVARLREAFNRQFPWGADWKVCDLGNKMFLVDFASRTWLEEMDN
jgi:hypothetical protein